MASIEDKVNQRIKCRAYKNLENPDGRETLCSEPIQVDEDGRQFFEVPGHQREYLSKLLPSYEFSESYDVTDEKPKGPAPKKAGRPKANHED